MRRLKVCALSQKLVRPAYVVSTEEAGLVLTPTMPFEPHILSSFVLEIPLLILNPFTVRRRKGKPPCLS
jgi:hypothetical protein